MNLDYQIPRVNFEAATAEERRIAESYTRVRKILVQDSPDAHTSWLKVDNQYFCVSLHYSDTREEAEWSCLMIAKALLAFKELER